MLISFSRKCALRGVLFGLLLLLAFSGSVNSSVIDVGIHSQDSVEILLLMDHDYGANVPFIIEIFERYGWSITTTGLNETLTSCAYLGYELFSVDILMTDIDEVAQFDAISVMPGESHELLRTNQTSLNLIKEAVSQGLVVSAWCRGVRVLAAADVIDGKNITGNADYASEYEAAGAIFNELVPPIIDGNIVTGTRSRFYREEMCEAIATAIGVYEVDAPVLVSVIVSPQSSTLGTNVTFTVEFSDVTGVYSVDAGIFALNDTTGERVSDIHVQCIALDETSTDGIFTGLVEGLEIGNYTIDFKACDVYLNEITCCDAVNLLVVEQTTSPGSTPNPMQWIVPGAVGGVACIVVILVLLRKR